MAELKSLGNTFDKAAEKLKQQLAEATDFNKLVKNKNFLAELKKLPQAEQFKIFEEYKDKFIELSKNPRSSLAEWTESFTKNLPNINAVQKNFGNEIQQGQQFIQGLSNTLGQISQSSSK